jgi:signal transduction histidine kinase
VRDPDRLQALIDAMLLVAGDLEISVVLHTITQTAVDLAGASYGALGVLDVTGTGLAEFVTVGLTPEEVGAVGPLPEGLGILGLLIKDPRPLRLDDLGLHPESAGFPDGHPPMQSFLGVPITVADHAFGNLYLCDKQGGGSFSEEDEDMVGALGVAAGLAIDKARLHARLRELTVTEERERIARDLHASVIQRLFTVGLSLQGTLRLAGRPGGDARLQEAIDELDDTIRQIRSTVFAMGRPRRLTSTGVRREILELIDVATRDHDIETRVDLDGAIDELHPEVADFLLMALREALSNVVRHARADEVDVEVRAEGGALLLRVADDGIGFDIGTGGGRGLAALEERAKLMGGWCEIGPRVTGGTELVWQIRSGPEGRAP